MCIIIMFGKKNDGKLKSSIIKIDDYGLPKELITFAGRTESEFLDNIKTKKALTQKFDIIFDETIIENGKRFSQSKLTAVRCKEMNLKSKNKALKVIKKSILMVV